MLDHDISTRDAYRLLARSNDTIADGSIADDTGPNGWSRRRFLQAVGMGVGSGLALGALGPALLGTDIPEAWAGTPIGAKDGILITIMLYGGNDGLNTLVPYSNGLYYQQRPNLAIAPSLVLPIDGNFGLHPNLGYLQALYQANQLAILHNVGYPNPDLSHFNSMGIWMSGKLGPAPIGTGWLGRWLDGVNPAVAQFAGATVGNSVPLHMNGSLQRAIGVPQGGGMFGSASSTNDAKLYASLNAMAAPAGMGTWHDRFSATLQNTIAVGTELAPAFTPDTTGGELVQKLTMAARLINRNVGMRVIDVGLGAFDTHDNQPGRHNNLMTELDAGLQAFFSTLEPQWASQVTLVTMSEFGRTSYSNNSLGTDHGTANTMFVIGPNVKGGQYGTPVRFESIQSQWDRFDFTGESIDFHSVFGTLIDGWLGGGGQTVLNGAFPNLGFFQAGPGDPPLLPPVPPTGLPPSPQTDYVPLTPVRLFDTRNGDGGRLGALGPGEFWTFLAAGQKGIPNDAVALALNLTAIGPTTPTFITVWPTGSARSLTSNLNPIPGVLQPNLVTARLGAGGNINLFNNVGYVHLAADLVGYFKDGSNIRLDSLTPDRLLDTRDGTGGFSGKIGAGQTIDLQVTGRSGVVDGAKAVALNVTVTEPDAPSFITAFPTGQPRPGTSSLNMMPNQTVPNLVYATIGAGGKVSFFNLQGSTHLVVDVLGAFVEYGQGKFVAVGPSRVLDTRNGTGAPLARLGAGELTLQLTGHKGVPNYGASAVLLNVTAVSPTEPTFLTVYPTDAARPTASNVNALPGQVSPNMVVARLGNDGAVKVFNRGGEVDVVADVFGYFT